MSEGSPMPSEAEQEAFEQNPHLLYSALRAEAPVSKVTAPGGLGVWMVTRYEDARPALSSAKLSKNVEIGQKVIEQNTDNEEMRLMFATELSAHMLNSDPPVHTRLRKLVNKVFTPRAVERLRPRIEEVTTELLDAMERAGRVDLMSAFAAPLPIAVICELLGVPLIDQDRFRGWVDAQLSGDPERLAEAAPALLGYLDELVASKRANPSEDLLTDLVHASDGDDKLSAQELVSMAFLLLVAGHETTVNLIGNGVLALLRHPDQLAALRADRSLLPGAIEEFLRYEGPVNTASLRFTTEPVELGGVVIPANQLVVVAVASANRDESQFPDGDKLDITRETGGHLAFGHGIHYCVGAPLARLEAEIAFGRLLDRFPDIRLDVDDADVRWKPGTVLRALKTLPVRVSAE
ncbi:cytochrome P450 family protein [Streptomyces netropsis]|uniref:Cytochrome P450 n=1 Tax=Streptomyces netropsis TaxID=55404 RepID=A0A7W7LAC9_STRNE|nr:cytochrome P450 [Streptomyces netropsis]MBB4886379.1 cytochrome P450 [Streptomyces netropsis]GGR19765.1 cytochrome P450 [Streptomyces netropsis]